MLWLKTLKSSGLEAMAWAALPVVLGEDFLTKQEKLLPSIVSAIVTRNKEEGLLSHLEAMHAYPTLAPMARSVSAPCLVISGADDPLVTQEGAKELAALCNARHEHIGGVGHSVPTEAPELFRKTVMEFLLEA
jgi:pimeloyl-ACP methyl ester carboxylesterase